MGIVRHVVSKPTIGTDEDAPNQRGSVPQQDVFGADWSAASPRSDDQDHELSDMSVDAADDDDADGDDDDDAADGTCSPSPPLPNPLKSPRLCGKLGDAPLI